MEKHVANDDENLTTEGARDPLLVLAHFGDSGCALLCLSVTVDVDVGSRSGKINEVVHRFWSEMRRETPGVHGCRWMWSDLLFAGSLDDADRLVATATRVAKESAVSNVQIGIVWTTAAGDADAKLRIVDDMFEELSARWNFGKHGNRFQRATYKAVDAS
jgi:hypothetical protein